jgi:hypothetical protein
MMPSCRNCSDAGSVTPSSSSGKSRAMIYVGSARFAMAPHRASFTCTTPQLRRGGPRAAVLLRVAERTVPALRCGGCRHAATFRADLVIRQLIGLDDDRIDAFEMSDEGNQRKLGTSMRQFWAGTALMLASLFVNQLATVLDLRYGTVGAIAAAVIGYGLLITSEPLKKLWRWVGVGRLRRKVAVILVVGVVTGAMGSLTAYVLIAVNQKEAAKEAALTPTSRAKLKHDAEAVANEISAFLSERDRYEPTFDRRDPNYVDKSSAYTRETIRQYNERFRARALLIVAKCEEGQIPPPIDNVPPTPDPYRYVRMVVDHPVNPIGVSQAANLLRDCAVRL